MKSIIFLGRGPLAEHCMSVLLSYDQLQTKAIVSNTESYQAALSNFTQIVQPRLILNSNRNESEIIETINSMEISVLISVQHPWILSKRVLDAVKGVAFNLHNAKIPEYKGHHSISHAILNRETSYTSTIHWMIPDVDMGDIAYETTIPLYQNETAWSVYQRSFEVAMNNFNKLINDLIYDMQIPKKMVVGTGRFYSKKEVEYLKQIQNINDYDEVHLKARAFYFPPREPAYFILRGEKFYVSPVPY